MLCMCETDFMRMHVRHRWISCLALLAMLSAFVVVSAATFAASIGAAGMAMSDGASSHTGMAHTGMAHVGMAHQAQNEHGATSAAHQTTPCKSCPQCPKQCPKPCSDQASCFLKCFQNSSLAAPADGTERIIVRNVVWPRRIAAVRATSVPPLLRPPSV